MTRRSGHKATSVACMRRGAARIRKRPLPSSPSPRGKVASQSNGQQRGLPDQDRTGNAQWKRGACSSTRRPSCWSRRPAGAERRRGAFAGTRARSIPCFWMQTIAGARKPTHEGTLKGRRDCSSKDPLVGGVGQTIGDAPPAYVRGRLSNNALVLTLPSSGQGRGVGGLRSGTCAYAPLRRGAMSRDRSVGGLLRQRSTAPAVGPRGFHIRGEFDSSSPRSSLADAGCMIIAGPRTRTVAPRSHA